MVHTLVLHELERRTLLVDPVYRKLPAREMEIVCTVYSAITAAMRRWLASVSGM